MFNLSFRPHSHTPIILFNIYKYNPCKIIPLISTKIFFLRVGKRYIFSVNVIFLRIFSRKAGTRRNNKNNATSKKGNSLQSGEKLDLGRGNELRRSLQKA